MSKVDYLGVCNDRGVPVEDFRLAFCSRCFQPECSRSRSGTTKFEARVANWRQRLFHAPQLPKTDPRWQQISAKKFLTLAAGPTPTVREWIDPATLDTSPKMAQVIPTVTPVPAQKAPENPSPLTPKKDEPAPEPIKPVQPRQNLFMNTPYAEPVMLGNRPVNPAEPKDKWAGPTPMKPGEKKVEPGAKIKIGRRT